MRKVRRFGGPGLVADLTAHNLGFPVCHPTEAVMKLFALTLAALLVAGSAQAQTTCKKDDFNPSRTVCTGPGGTAVREKNPFGGGDRITTSRGVYTQQNNSGTSWSGPGGNVTVGRGFSGGTDVNTPRGTYHVSKGLNGTEITGPNGRTQHCEQTFSGQTVCK
jgi:hypothetical protein